MKRKLVRYAPHVDAYLEVVKNVSASISIDFHSLTEWKATGCVLAFRDGDE